VWAVVAVACACARARGASLEIDAPPRAETGDRVAAEVVLEGPVDQPFDGYVCLVTPGGYVISAVRGRNGALATRPGVHRYVAAHPPLPAGRFVLPLVDAAVPRELSRGEYRFLAACVPVGGGGEALRAEARLSVDWCLDRDVETPMRDGTLLRGDLRRQARDGRFPVLVFRTPYSKDEGDLDNERTFRRAVDRGYAVLVQDVRGRYRSGGDYTPYVNEGRDGYDTIEWAAAQPWSDGNVGTFGLSYPGAVQWLAALESPPHLKAMVPAMCFSTIREFIYFGGVFETAWSSWVYVDMTPDTRVRHDLSGPRTVDEAKAEYVRIGVDVIQGWLPQNEMPYLADTAPYYYDWLAHGPYEAYWDWGVIEGRYDRVKAAVLNLSGWYDEAYGTQGATANYLGLLASRVGEADPRTKLVIGPWIHGVDATASAAAGDRTFGPSAVIDYDDVVLSWLDRYVRGVENWIDDAAPVHLFVMGDDRWRREEAWPPSSARTTPVYLAAGEGRGALVLAPPADGSRSFVADPQDPVRDDYGTNFGATDLRWLADRPDILTFETGPLPADVEVTGPIAAEVWISSDAPDCDIYTVLLDVAPDGTAYNLMGPGNAVLRASARGGTPTREPLVPGTPVKLTLDRMRNANTFKAGHRLRLCIAASWFPIYSRNLQTGLSEAESAVTRTATITVHHGTRRPSRLLLPVVPR